MSAQKFTPGPWEAHPIMRWVSPAADMEMPICALRQATNGIPADDVEAHANANLIAASPDLYDALAAICAGSIDTSGTAIILGDDAWTKLSNGMHALAKAEGRS